MMETQKYVDMLFLQEEMEVLNEVELKVFLQKLLPEVKMKKFLTKVAGTIDKKRPFETLLKVKKLFAPLPNITTESIDSFMSRKYKNYLPLKKVARTVLRNSIPDASDRMIDTAATFVTISSMVAKKGEKIDERTRLKQQIKECVMKVRKFIDANEEEAEKRRIGKEEFADIAIAFVIISMASAVGLALAFGIYTILSTIAGLLAPLMVIAAIVAAIFIAVRIVIIT